jgi:small subunit ribosomal protein S5
VRSLLDAAGYNNMLTKVLGTNNPHNVVRAVVDALQRLESPEQYAARVGKNVDDLMGDYNVGAHVWGQAANG